MSRPAAAPARPPDGSGISSANFDTGTGQQHAAFRDLVQSCEYSSPSCRRDFPVLTLLESGELQTAEARLLDLAFKDWDWSLDDVEDDGDDVFDF